MAAKVKDEPSCFHWTSVTTTRIVSSTVVGNLFLRLGAHPFCHCVHPGATTRLPAVTFAPDSLATLGPTTISEESQVSDGMNSTPSPVDDCLFTVTSTTGSPPSDLPPFPRTMLCKKSQSTDIGQAVIKILDSDVFYKIFPTPEPVQVVEPGEDF